MTAWRHDPHTDRTVRIAPGRAQRPSDFSGAGYGRCPFCAGNEADTPDELDRVGDGDGGWLCRVVPNRFPSFDGEAGAQEVIVESPRHESRFEQLPAHEAAAAVTMWARRLATLRETDRFDYLLVFKNQGEAAGATLQHTHSQVVALRETPAMVAAMWRRLASDGSPAGESVVDEAEGWLVATPPAPRMAAEAVVAPSDPASRFADLAIDADEAARLAELLQRVMAAAIRVANQPALNLVVQTPPRGVRPPADRPWWIEVIPRASSIAGLELATGLWVNTLAPESAAEALRRELVEPMVQVAGDPADQARDGAPAAGASRRG